MSSETGIFSNVSRPVTIAGGKFHFIPAFGNVGVLDTADGILLFDIGTRVMGNAIFQSVRAATAKPVRFIVYSHGHFDHCFGYAPFQSEWAAKGWAPPEVIAHENAVRRFEKYRMLGPYHVWINAQQFGSLFGARSVKGTGVNDAITAQETLNPTTVLHGQDPYRFSLGQKSIELHPAQGETDDALWMYLPENEIICAGDLFVSSFPNVGNPFKVQRYPKQWAEALMQMDKLDVRYLAPGHGPLIEGREKVHEALSVTAEALNFVHNGVVKRLNEGKWFEEIYWELMDDFQTKYPAKLKNSPYLQPIYGCYQFAIHATYRLYHGWYATGNPTDLFPAKHVDVNREILQVLGPDAESNFFRRATALFEAKNFQMALHLLDLVILSDRKESEPVHNQAIALKVKALKHIAELEPSFIARNIYTSAARRLQKEASASDKER